MVVRSNYLFGQYKRIRDEYSGVLTGKGLEFGGSLARTEATGYGVCYYTQEALRVLRNDSFEGKTVVISGSATWPPTPLRRLSSWAPRSSPSPGLQRLHLRPERHQRRGRQADQGSRARPHQGIRRGVPGSEYHEGSKGVWTVKGDIACRAPPRTRLMANPHRSSWTTA